MQPLLAALAVERHVSGRRLHAALHAGDVAAGAESLALAGQDHVEILRAFRPGASLPGNGEPAERMAITGA